MEAGHYVPGVADDRILPGLWVEKLLQRNMALAGWTDKRDSETMENTGHVSTNMIQTNIST